MTEAPASTEAARPAGDGGEPADAVLRAMRARLARAAKLFADGAARLDTLLDEATPFVEAARRAAGEAAAPDAPLEHSAAWREARSFAWLLAYRLGDQGWPAHVAAAVIPAWREAVAPAWPHAVAAADELVALMVDAFARGREDRARAEAQRGLADALPVTELAPHVVLIVAAGALDPDGARALCDRASSFLLRRDAKAALLDIEGLIAPTAAVLAELWSIPSAARMLGVRMVVSGVTGLVGEMVAGANLHDEGEQRVASLAQGVEALLREARVVIGGAPGVGAWLRGLLRAKR